MRLTRARVRLRIEVNAGPRKTIYLNYPLSQLVRSGRGEADPVPESVAAAASNRKSLKRNRRRRRRSHTSLLRRARLFGTHAPRDKERPEPVEHPSGLICGRHRAQRWCAAASSCARDNSLAAKVTAATSVEGSHLSLRCRDWSWLIFQRGSNDARAPRYVFGSGGA